LPRPDREARTRAAQLPPATAERALADARRRSADHEKRAEGAAGRHPHRHKDIYNTKGIRTTAHSRLLQDNVPEADATSVRLLAEAGTVLLASSPLTSSPLAARPSTCLGAGAQSLEPRSLHRGIVEQVPARRHQRRGSADAPAMALERRPAACRIAGVGDRAESSPRRAPARSTIRVK